MRTIHLFPLSLLVAAAAFSCSKKEENEGDRTPPEPTIDDDAGATPQATDDAGGDVGPPPGTEDPTGNPILLGPPREVRSFNAGGEAQFVDGPQWSAARNAMWVSLPLARNLEGGRGILTTFKEDGTNYTELRAGDNLTTGVIGNSIDKDGNLISAELKSITRTTPDGTVTTIADAYSPINPQNPAEVPVKFDTPNDLVALDDGTIFVTDPGYAVTPRPDKGHLIRISAPEATTGRVNVTAAQTYDTNPSPNGIALSKDQKTLYVGFTQPPFGTLPYVRKYTINADRSLTDVGKFIELPVDSQPDGLALDESDNLFVALKTGIAVFKATGEPYGGAGAKLPQTPIAGEVTGVTFIGQARKSLLVTTTNGKALELKVKVAGLAQ
ncbi:MAG: SMP-30/gluconolactonase/LRE family protein [Labilithrix sp.]|nr:SMP-30/gluconolactonase/LRE family protein [Labilithrix sp.]